MKIIVCIKQVPDTAGGVKFNPDGTLDRAAMLTIMNPDDKAGLEAALRLKDQYGAEVTVLTMGLPKAGDTLREALAMGADNAVLVTDRCLGGDTAQVGPQISEHLDIPVISYARKIEIEGDAVKVQRQYDDRYHVVKAQMPCLITCLAELNDPRYMTPGGIFDACEAEIATMGRADLKTLEDGNMGLAGSPTKIAKASDKVRKGAGEKITLDTEEAVSYLLGKMTEKHVCGL